MLNILLWIAMIPFIPFAYIVYLFGGFKSKGSGAGAAIGDFAWGIFKSIIIGGVFYIALAFIIAN